MSHKNKKSLVDQVKQSLDSKLAIDRSKHQDPLTESQLMTLRVSFMAVSVNMI